MRKGLVGLCVLCAWGLGAGAWAETEAPAPTESAAEVEAEAPLSAETRRILLITVDSLRADHVGAPTIPTPALDRLLREGTWLAGATTPTPSTGPAHASLLTGLHPWRHGVDRDARLLADEQTTLAERVAEAGATTAAFVSMALLHPSLGFAQGFETYRFAPTEFMIWRDKRREKFWSRGDATVAASMDWLSEHSDVSFLLWVHLFDVHAPYLPPPEFAESPDTPVDLAGKLVPQPLRGPDALAQEIRRYRGEVRAADHRVGRLLQHLDALGIAGDTHVVLTAGHGEGLGDHGWLGHDANLFDELIRVPLLVRGPGIPAARRIVGPAQLEDLHPTLLSMLGVSPSPEAELDGRDLLPWLRGERAISPRRTSLGQRRSKDGEPPSFYVRSASTKWIGDPATGGEVFDLAADPREFAASAEGTVPPALAQRLAALPPKSVEPVVAEVSPDEVPAAKPAAPGAKPAAKPSPPERTAAQPPAPVEPTPVAPPSPPVIAETPPRAEPEATAAVEPPERAAETPSPEPEPSNARTADVLPPRPAPLPEPPGLRRQRAEPEPAPSTEPVDEVAEEPAPMGPQPPIETSGEPEPAGDALSPVPPARPEG